MNNLYESFIRSAYKVVDDLERAGEPTLANKLLEVTNESATVLIGNHCPICNKLITDEAELEFLHVAGLCLGCDHVRADTVGERKN